MMSRSALSLVALLIASTLCLAMMDSRSRLPLSQRAALCAAKSVPQVLRQEPLSVKKEPQLEVTRTTEVKLDGRPCRYEDVPANVEAVHIEVADDGKTILKIHFRTRKR
jgi:hypothetical protein